MVEVEVGVRRRGWKESAGDRALTVRMVEREVEVAGERTCRRLHLDHAFDSSNPDVRDVDVGRDRGAWDRRVVYSGCAGLVVARELGHDPRIGEAMDIAAFVPPVALRQSRGGDDVAVRLRRDRAEILDVGRNEEPVDIEK